MKLHLGNLPKSLSDEKLMELARPFGTPESAEVVRDRINGESRGYGFVVYPTEAEARAAITGLDGKEFDGSTIRVSEARSPKDRERARV